MFLWDPGGPDPVFHDRPANLLGKLQEVGPLQEKGGSPWRVQGVEAVLTAALHTYLME